MTHVVVMGVSGSGKSTVGAELARSLDAAFLDADDLHSPANVAKMTAGVPLTDADREPWLDAVAAAAAAEQRVVVACSALRRAYRDRLRRALPDGVFVHLAGAEAELAARMLARPGHFMPPALLASQLAILEPLAADERGGAVDIRLPLAEVVARAAELVATPWRIPGDARTVEAWTTPTTT